MFGRTRTATICASHSSRYASSVKSHRRDHAGPHPTADATRSSCLSTSLRVRRRRCDAPAGHRLVHVHLRGPATRRPGGTPCPPHSTCEPPSRHAPTRGARRSPAEPGQRPAAKRRPSPSAAPDRGSGRRPCTARFPADEPPPPVVKSNGGISSDESSQTFGRIDGLKIGVARGAAERLNRYCSMPLPSGWRPPRPGMVWSVGRARQGHFVSLRDSLRSPLTGARRRPGVAGYREDEAPGTTAGSGPVVQGRRLLQRLGLLVLGSPPQPLRDRRVITWR